MTDLEKLLAETTPGPWAATERETQFCIHPHDLPAAYQGRIADVIYWRANHTGHRRNPLHGEAASNARLIALSPSLAAALLVAERALHSGISFAEEWIYEHGGIEGCDYSDLRAFQSMKSALSEIEKLTGGGE